MTDVAVIEYPLVARIGPKGRRDRLQWMTPDQCVKLRAPGPLTLYQCFIDYTAEHCRPNKGDPKRAWIAFQSWIDALGPDRECETLERADGRTVWNHELNRGVCAATARKHLTMGQAALNHAKTEGRIKEVPKFQLPPPSENRVDFLTREQHAALIAVPKPWARQLFWLLAFGTGARTTAILELDWQRTDLLRRVIDFRVPGVVYKNKRRAIVPINKELHATLEAYYPRRDPACERVVTRFGKPYVMGSLYHGCKADLAAIGINKRGVARHVARHTVATWMLQGDPARGIPPAPIQKVAQFLGDRVSMVEKTYAHVLPTDLHDVARLLETE